MSVEIFIILIIQILLIMMVYRYNKSIQSKVTKLSLEFMGKGFSQDTIYDNVREILKQVRYVSTEGIRDKIDDIRFKDLNSINSDLLVIMNMVRYLQDDIDLMIENNPELNKLRENHHNYNNTERFISSTLRKYPKRYEDASLIDDFSIIREDYFSKDNL